MNEQIALENAIALVKSDFAEEYPQPLDDTEILSTDTFEKEVGEGGKDDTWYHDPIDGELDDKWQAGMKLMGVLKHLPGRHDQKDHGRYGPHSDRFPSRPYAFRAAEKLGGEIERVKSGEFKLVESKDVPTPDNKEGRGTRVMDLTSGPHYKRIQVGEETKVRVLGNGTKKESVVPKFKYVDQNGKEATDTGVIERLRKMAPPGVTDVVLNADPKGEVQAIWKDAKGDWQSKYSKTHTKEQAAEKFERLKEFDSALRKIRRQVNQDVDTVEEAAVLYLIDKTAIRAGTGGQRETSAKVKAYGASNLLNRHVTVNGNKVTFDFIGKKGVRIQKSLRDDKLAEIINKRKTANWSDPLFKTSYTKVMHYLKQIDDRFKIHDFRTWNATNLALKLIKKRKGPAPTERAFGKWQKQVAIRVGKHLGNAPAQSLNSYIDPSVWNVWRKPEWGQWLPKAMKGDNE